MHNFTGQRCVPTTSTQKRSLKLVTFIGVLGLSAFADNPPGPEHPNQPRDPGVRAGRADAGDPVSGLNTGELAMFNSSRITFQEVDGTAEGLGPRFNLDSCSAATRTPPLAEVARP